MKARPQVHTALLALLATLAAETAFAALPVPLTVQEEIPAGVTGLARAASPVTVGIPLEEAAGITSVSQLGLVGATAGQFRELARWPSGNLKWVLADFQADVLAGGATSGISLSSGAGNFGGANLATDGGSAITVSTGAATFTISKSGFRMLDQVTVGGTTLVQSGGEGVGISDAAGVRYTSANDAASSVVLEENGPLRAVVRASGSLKNSGGVRLAEYLVRLNFYKGKSSVRAWVSLRNAQGANPTVFAFNSADVSVKLALGAGPRFATSTSRGAVNDALAANETAYVYQAHSTQNDYYENSYANAPMAHSGSTFTQSGVEVRKVGGTTYQALSGNDTDVADGWMALEDASGKGCAAGMRWMGSLWPAGLEVSGDGTARVELFSKRNSMTGLRFAWGAYETREVYFQFYASPPASRSTMLYEMQYPLAARATLTQYAAAGAIFGETKLVSAADQQAWFAQRGGVSPSLANITPQFMRYHAWSMGGGGNQTNFAFLDLVDYLRTGNGGFLAQGERNTLYKADTAVRHSDGFDYTTNQIDPGDEGSGPNLGTFNGRIFDFEHPHWISLPIAYFLTGNEIYKDATADFGEWKLGMGDGVSPLYYNPVNIFGDGSMRIWSRYYRDYAILYDVTRDVRYWSDLDRMTTGLLTSQDVPGSALPAGRNYDRGYIWLAHGSYQLPRSVSDFMTVQIHFEAMWEGLRLLRERGDSRVEAVEDYLLGLADFIYNEWYFDTGSGQGQFGYLYSYHLDEANNSATNPYWVEGFRPISSSRPLTFAYLMTGDAKYLDREAKLLIGDIDFVTPRTPTDYSSEAYMSTDLYRPAATGWFAVPGLTAQNLGGGSYRLTWTAPSGATAYRVKTADRPIVPWLGFDQNTRTFAFPPASHKAWFAAGDVANEPTPAPAGSPESFTVSGLDPSKVYSFALRYTTNVRDTTPPAPVSNLIAR